ncbi:CGNR zinc finger domain-containing protein [Kribbella sp. CA-294648]|uniref:CGNR zinc finger domain-containing protein n=1 Tax=Kribbella sp. CA-294648 TaxID=3239948 RepID=UPI003D920B27
MAVDLLAFPFIGGRPVLNFLGTLGKRTTEPLERLRTPEDLTRWSEKAGLAGQGVISAGPADLEAARALREALYGLTMSALGRASAEPGDVEIVNYWAAQPTPVPGVAIRSGVLHREDPAPTASAVLAAVARDGIDLLTGPDVESIRECEDATCTLLFLDTSRGHRRRWCSMNICGARAKMRTLRASN